MNCKKFVAASISVSYRTAVQDSVLILMIFRIDEIFGPKVIVAQTSLHWSSPEIQHRIKDLEHRSKL